MPNLPTSLPTNDIVGRLRQYARNRAQPPDDPVEGYLEWQAAEEIVRLRMETAALRQDREATNIAWQAEVERLRGVIEFGQTASRQQREGFQAEIERLRAALQHIADDAIVERLPRDIARAALEGK